MEKSPEAFRTISEVADWLGVPTHVLRFWESRFSQIKPVKRAGGRRYYRPTDMSLIGGIKRLLHDDGMTIRGVQKLLREKGAKHVAGLSQPLDGTPIADTDVIESTGVEVDVSDPPASEAPHQTEDPAPDPEPQTEPEPELAEEPIAAEVPDNPDPAPEPLESSAAADPAPLPEADPAEETLEAEIPQRPGDEPAAAPGHAIPATPDVPDTDPDDADTAYPARPSVAARLRVADAAYMRRNRDALATLKTRLVERTGA